MCHFPPKAVVCICVILVFSPAGPATQAATCSVRVDGASDGVTERSMGATESCTRFDISDLVRRGLRNYRIWAGMSRVEPADDDRTYGQPSITEVKVNPNVINWSAWDTQFFRKDSYHFSPDCSTSAQISLYDLLTALRDNGIKTVVTLCNVDNNGQPTWAAKLNPPRTAEDWNEWWEHVFATVYSINVRYGLDVHDWQIHNEPDRDRQGWKGTLQDYIEFTRSTRDAIQYVYDTYLPGESYRLYAPVATGLNSWVEQSLI